MKKKKKKRRKEEEEEENIKGRAWKNDEAIAEAKPDLDHQRASWDALQISPVQFEGHI